MMLKAAPKGSVLVREVLTTVQHGLESACSTSGLPDLVLRLLDLPDVCQVSALCPNTACWNCESLTKTSHARQSKVLAGNVAPTC